jgi:hypothetical protein
MKAKTISAAKKKIPNLPTEVPDGGFKAKHHCEATKPDVEVRKKSLL